MSHKVTAKLHPKQMVAFKSDATEILYGGAAGGGKSHLIRVRAIALCMAVKGLQVYMFRRVHSDLVKTHMADDTGFPPMLAGMIQLGYCWIAGDDIHFKNGSCIYLCHCQHEKDKLKYQGPQIHVLLIDELTQFTESIYRYLRGRCRVPKSLEIPTGIELPLILCGANPGGIGHNFVKRGWIDVAPALEITRMKPKEGGMLRQFIPSRLIDNPSIDAKEYEGKLRGLGDSYLVDAMLKGDWDIVAGGALDDVWDRSKHVIQQWEIPSGWRVDRGFDWGSTAPFSTLWFAESDGTPMNGKSYPRGSVIVCREWYGAEDGTEDGLRMVADEIAEGIKEREAEGYLSKLEIYPGPADNSINDVVNGNCIATDMAGCGISWTKSNKGSGSRVAGLNKMRSMLKEAAKDRPEAPGLWIMDSCVRLIGHLPVLCRDQKKIEDIDTNQPDHDYDVLRYRVNSEKHKTQTKRVGGFY